MNHQGDWDGPFDADTVYDLTQITLKNVETLWVSGASTGWYSTSRASTTSRSPMSHRSAFFNGGVLTTADATLDLSGKSVGGGGVIKSANASGTTFRVDSAEVAALIVGGAGQDTVVVGNRTLTARSAADLRRIGPRPSSMPREPT